MSVTVDDLKYADLDDNDKSLFDAGLMDINGNVTSSGWELLKQLQFEEYKQNLAVAARKALKAKKV